MKLWADWITSPCDPGAAAVTFRREFTPSRLVKKATVKASAMGIYAFYLNGNRVGKGVLAPGWTSYDTRIQYQTYDVTDQLKSGVNRLEFGVGQGWAVSYLTWDTDNHHFFADQTALIARLDVVYEDGTKESVCTAPDWTVYTSPVTSSELYHGETVDMTACIRKIGAAVPAKVKSHLVPQQGEWITEQERLAPIKLIRTPAGETVLDFGQNMTGYVEVTVQGKKGDRIVLHHAEVLDADGNFYTENMRHARNENVYILSGKQDVFKPTYCFQGFRYVKLVEYPFPTVDLNQFCGVVVHSDMKRTGHFTCGNEKINQLYHNIVWGQKGNFLDIPTDCPQRDERLGWTGDAQVFCRTAAINYDVEVFFRKWLTDVMIEQGDDGSVAGIVPHCIKSGRSRVSAAWGDVVCIVPWQMYLAYGNKDELRRLFPAMKKWVDYMHAQGDEEFLWLGGTHYGDWLAMDSGEDSFVGLTSHDMIASAYYAYSCSLVIKAGHVLGEDVRAYEKLHKNVVRKFRETYMENGLPKLNCAAASVDLINPLFVKHNEADTQTGLSMILVLGLSEPEERPALAKRLVEKIRQAGNRIETGFVGTSLIMHALSENGYADVAYDLLFREESPSWLYSVCHGATTMWEHWNSQKEDGSFWRADMNSFNHYAYGAVFDWIFGVACGVKPAENAPAYEEYDLCPVPDKRLGFADASLETRQGELRVKWYYKDEGVFYEFTVPAGCVAHMQLPDGRKQDLTGGVWYFAETN